MCTIARESDLPYDCTESRFNPNISRLSGPFSQRRQRGEDRLDMAAGLQAEDGAAVVEEIELDVAAAADELLFAVGLGPRRHEIAAHQVRIDFFECLPHVAGEGEIGLPVA